MLPGPAATTVGIGLIAWMIENRRQLRHASLRRRVLLIPLSTAILLHYLVSLALWGMIFLSLFRDPVSRRGWPSFLWEMIPALVLTTLAAITLVLCWRGHHAATRALFFLLASSVAFFAIDTAFGRWQIHVFIATKEYWADGGKRHEYLTWWWYNDLWFT